MLKLHQQEKDTNSNKTFLREVMPSLYSIHHTTRLMDVIHLAHLNACFCIQESKKIEGLSTRIQQSISFPTNIIIPWNNVWALFGGTASWCESFKRKLVKFKIQLDHLDFTHDYMQLSCWMHIFFIHILQSSITKGHVRMM